MIKEERLFTAPPLEDDSNLVIYPYELIFQVVRDRKSEVANAWHKVFAEQSRSSTHEVNHS